MQRSRLDRMQTDGTQQALTIEPGDKPDRFTIHAAGLAAGDYVLVWQVLSVDGHITRGNIPFHVLAA